MRIIAGKARRLPLKTPEGLDTRPTSDKIKETLFNMLQTAVPGAYFLDLFAGSGQIGLEAVSRGCAYCVFVENNRRAVKCIEENIAFTKSAEQTSLIAGDAAGALQTMEGTYAFDLIFMDPPYRQGMEKQVLAYLAHSSLLKPEAQIIVEAAAGTKFDYLDELGFEAVKYKQYKTNMHVFIQKKQVD